MYNVGNCRSCNVEIMCDLWDKCKNVPLCSCGIYSLLIFKLAVTLARNLLDALLKLARKSYPSVWTHPVADLWVSSVISCWKVLTKILFSEPPPKKGKVAQVSRSKSLSSIAGWGTPPFFSFSLFQKPLKFVLGLPKFKLRHWRPHCKLLTRSFS